MKKNILYLLMGIVFSFVSQEKVQATGLDHEKDLPKTKVGASFVPPLGPGEIALIKGYKAEGLSIDLNRVRGLMSWTQISERRFSIRARSQLNIDSDYTKGLYEDYKPIYDAIVFAWKHGSQKGESIFVREAASKLNIDPAYAKILYAQQRPDEEPKTVIEEQEEASQTASSAAAQSSASPLKSSVTSGTTTASSSSSSEPTVLEEKEQEKRAQATGSNHEKDLPKTKAGASFIPPLGPGEIALINGYKSAGLSINLCSVRGLMSWTQKGIGLRGFVMEARCQFNMDSNYAKGLYQDYKPIYDAIVFAWKHGSQKGKSIFIREAVSKFNMDPAYARTLYAQQRPDAEPETIIEEQEEASQAASSAATQPNASPLKSLVTLGTTTASSSSSSEPAVHEEKEQEDFVSSATWTSTSSKPFTGLRHRNISPPPD